MADAELAALRQEVAELRAQLCGGPSLAKGSAAPLDEPAAARSRQFADEGWLVIDGVITPGDVESLRAVLDEPEFASAHSVDQCLLRGICTFMSRFV